MTRQHKNFLSTQKDRIALTGNIYMLMMAYAVSNTIVGPLMPKIIRHYQLGLAQGALIVSFQSIGGILAIIIGGLLADIFKKSKIVTIGFALYCVGLFTVGYAPSYGLLLFSFFIIGASRMVDTVLNAYISDLHPGNRSTYLNLLHTFYGIGAFMGPFIVRLIFEREGVWNNTYMFLSFGCIILLVLFLLIVKKADAGIGKRRSIELKDFKSILINSNMWIICFVMFLYSGHQNGISVWLPMYMEDVLNVQSFGSGIALSVFWAGIVLGRFGASFLPERYKGKKFIRKAGLIGGIFLGVGVILKIPIILVASVCLTGLITGAIIPMLVALACNRHPENTGTVSSMIFITGTAASLVFPWIIGKMAETVGFQSGMFLTFIPLIFISIIIMFLFRE